MGFFNKLAQKAAELQAKQMELAQGLQQKMAQVAEVTQAHQAGVMRSLHGGGNFGFTPAERQEVRQLLDGAIAELNPTVRDGRIARLEKLRASSKPSLAWCVRCTRIYAGDDIESMASAALAAIDGNDHRCNEFLFPALERHCTDCACALGAKIPCVLTGESFVPTVDPSISPFGHTLAAPRLAEVLRNGGVIEADKSVRAVTPQEVEAFQAVRAAERRFKDCPVDVKARMFFVSGQRPDWIIGHYAKLRASAVGLDFAAGGYDASGIYWAVIDEEAFRVNCAQGRIEVDMSVDPAGFSPERSSALGKVAGGALSSGLHRASWGAHRWGGGGAIGAGMAQGAIQGFMAAAEEQRQADAARDAAIKAHVDVVLGTIGKLIEANIAQVAPPILNNCVRVPQSQRVTAWPSGSNVGRAAAVLAKHPYPG